MSATPVCHQLLAGGALGGANRLALQLAAHLGERGGRPHVWVPAPGPAWEAARGLGAPAVLLDYAAALGPSRLRAAVTNARVARALRRHGPGLAHVHYTGHYGSLWRGLRWTRLKTVVHVHIEPEAAEMRWAFRRPPDLIVACGRTVAGQVRALLPEGVRGRARVEAVPNAVDVGRFGPADDRAAAKARVGAPADVPLLLMLANLAPHKGQETAIRATAALRRRGVEAACWLAGVERGGDGTYPRRLEALRESLGLADRVRLLGERADAPDLLRAADVFLLPSTKEGLPLSVLEAQATGVPVVAAPAAGVPEVVEDGETGLLRAAGDAESYGDAVHRLLTEPGLAPRLAGRARARVLGEHTWAIYFGRVTRLYEEILGRPAVPPGGVSS